MNEKNEQIKDWNFDEFHIVTENYTDWDMYEKLKEVTNEDSVVLDLGTGGGEKVLAFFPNYVKEIIGIDISKAMIETANENLKKSGKKNISFKHMNNLKLEFPDEYFDVVVARHTIINAKEILRVLKPGGHVIIRGVDKYDCYELKKVYGKGQALNDQTPISIIDFDDLFDAGFQELEVIPLHQVEYYKDFELFYKFLLKVPILEDFSEDEENVEYYFIKELNKELLQKYVERNTFEKGIRLVRRYYGLTCVKPS